MPISLGDAFLLSETIYDKKHLHIVLKVEDNILIAINITSQLPRNNPGRNCKIEIGDHPWITKECYANVQACRKLKKSIIEKDIDDRIITTKETASFEFVNKLLSYCKNYEDYLPIEVSKILFSNGK